MAIGEPAKIFNERVKISLKKINICLQMPSLLAKANVRHQDRQKNGNRL
jgi:hypothetical protein